MTAVRRGAALVSLAVAALSAFPASPAGATAQDEPADSIFVVSVSGLLDPVTADLVERSVREANRERATLVILAVDSPGAVDVDLVRVLEAVHRSEVPVVAWVEGGGRALREAAGLLAVADLAVAAPDAEVGISGEDLDGRSSRQTRSSATLARRLRTERARALAGPVLDAADARRSGALDGEAPALRDLIAVLDGREVDVPGGAVTLDLGVRTGEGEKRVLPIRFRELGLGDQLEHALGSPSVALLLLVVGLCLLVFEFFAVGIGIAAVVGAGLVVAASVGFSHLPVNWVALGLLVGGVLAVGIDVQAGAARFWAVVGGVLFVAGMLRLYDGAASLDPPLWQVALLSAGTLLFLLPGLAAVVRARFSSPTIGRDTMVGEDGVASEAFDPEGVVVVRDAPWRARATRAADIDAGDKVRVTAVRGLLLEVEPIEPDESGAPAD